MVMFEVISRTTPFAGASSVALAQIVICGQRPTLPTQRVNYSCEREYVQLMEKCWNQDPELRPDFKQIAALLQQLPCD